MQKTQSEDIERQKLESAYATTMWQFSQIESNVFLVYVSAVRMSPKKDFKEERMEPLRAAYFSVNSFEARLSMTHAAMKNRWENTKHFDWWVKIYADCIKAKTQRGKIAHKAAFIKYPENTHQKMIYVLAEPYWHTNHPYKYGEAKSKGTDAAALLTLRDKWFKTSYDLSMLATELWSIEWNEERPKASS